MRNRYFGAVLMVAAGFLQGCGEKDMPPCPDAGQKFFQDSIDTYFSMNPKPGGKPVIDGEPFYDTSTNWWLVPIKNDENKMLALLSCDGRIELNGR